MTTHQYVIIEDEIVTIDTPEERTEALRQMREAGLDELQIWEGDPDAGTETETWSVLDAKLLTTEEVVEVITQCLHADSHESDREEAAERLAARGTVRIKSFVEACLLTRDAGLVLSVGGAEYQITVVRTR